MNKIKRFLGKETKKRRKTLDTIQSQTREIP